LFAIHPGDSVAMPHEHPPLADQLFALGMPGFVDEPWIDYPAVLGLTPADVPELVRTGTAPDFNDAAEREEEIWAAVHAWRALAQLGAVEAAEALAGLLGPEADDWLSGELPDVFRVLGPGTVPALASVVLDESRAQEAAELAAVVLVRMAKAHPGAAEPCVRALEARLHRHASNPIELNTILVGTLLDLEAAEAAATIQAVYASDRLDTYVTGDWEDAQVDLGLLPERLTPRPPNPLLQEIAAIERRWLEAGVGRDEWEDEPPMAAPRAGSRRERERARARKKMAKKSRKQNRRK
jgi:hypothetical protein